MLKKKCMDLTVGEAFLASLELGGIVLILEWIVLCTGWLQKACRFFLHFNEFLKCFKIKR